MDTPSETPPPAPELIDRARMVRDLEALLADHLGPALASPQMAALDGILSVLTGRGLAPRLSQLSGILTGDSDVELDALLDAIAERATGYRTAAGRARRYTDAAHAEALRRLRERLRL